VARSSGKNSRDRGKQRLRCDEDCGIYEIGNWAIADRAAMTSDDDDDDDDNEQRNNRRNSVRIQ
jgi:hypothetical protein